MSTNDNVFRSDFDDNYYFWLGDKLKGPFYDFTEAHLELSKELDKLREKENNNQTE